MEECKHALPDLETDHKKRAVDTILLLFAPAMLLMSFLSQFFGTDSLVSLYGWNALLVEGLVVFLPAILFIRKNGGFAAFGFVRITGREWAFSLIMGVGIFFFVTAINALFVTLWALFDFPQQSAPVPADTPLEVLLSLLFVAAVPAIAEETLFRGALFRSHMRYGMKRAMLHTSLLFALAHFQLASLPALFVAGLLFTYASRVTGSVYSSIAMHFSYNASAVVLSAFARGYLTEQAAGFAMDDMLGEFGGQFPELGGFAIAIFIIGMLFALAFYAGLGFGIGYPSYRALVRASARRFEIAQVNVRFREVKADVLAHVDGERAYNGENEETQVLPPPQDTPAVEPAPTQTGLGWRAALTYVLMGGLSLLFFLIDGLS